MVTSGMKDAGYVYVNIDDTWEGKRDAQGIIHAEQQIPRHEGACRLCSQQGTEAGHLFLARPRTCGGYRGQLRPRGAGCANPTPPGESTISSTTGAALARVYEIERSSRLPEMGDALAQSGRPIVYSLCEYGMGNVWEWGDSVGGNLWRTTGDISDDWTPMAKIGFGQAGHANYAGPGHWNDPDMLEVGNGGMSDDEYRTHLGLWAILAAPLIAGNDLTRMTPFTVDMLTNREVLAIDQDPLGKQGHPIIQEGPFEVWIKPMADHSFAVGLFNRSKQEDKMNVKFSDLSISGAANVRDVWLRKDLGVLHETFSAYVPKHGVVLLRISPR